LATPTLVTTTPSAGTDAHHIRAADVQMNNNRGSALFTSSSGNASSVGAYWYPGDEWKGDVARMMMYMYLRYSTQCLPNNVGIGTSVTIDPAMIDLFLQWNTEDTVSAYEKNRNNILENSQGNRNPFIDNPYLATLIWGGSPAQDNWNMTSIKSETNNNVFSIYPVPAANGQIHIYFKNNEQISNVKLYNVSGQIINELENPVLKHQEVNLNYVNKGFYLVVIQTQTQTITKKVIVD